MLFFYLRHGDPTYSPDSLTPLGKRQAEALAKRLSLHGIDEVFCSSSQRAIQTAKPTCEIIKKEMQIVDWSNEHYAANTFSWVDENGKRTWFYNQEETVKLFVSEEIREKGKSWYKHIAFKKLDLEQKIKDYDKKIDDFFENLGYKHDRNKNIYECIKNNNQRIAFFAHHGFGTYFLSLILDIPYPEFITHFGLQHAGMTVIHFDENKSTVIPKVLELSNDSHIYADGLPTCYDNRIMI